ncbi:MAG: tetratricopeptide repeat-containing sensor histidine kinase [Flammeovirgaceae bacterium]
MNIKVITIFYRMRSWQAMVCLSFILLSSNYGFAQDKNYIQALFKQLKSKNDSLKAAAYNELAWEYRRVNLDSADLFASKALVIAKNRQIQTELAAAYMRKGVIAKNRGSYRKAIQFYEQAYPIRKNILKNEKGAAGVLNNIGTCYTRLGAYDTAIQYLSRGLTIREQIKDYAGLVNSYINRGNLQEKLTNYKDALKDYELAATSLNKKDKLTQSDTLKLNQINQSIGTVNYRLENYEAAAAKYRACYLVAEQYGDVEGIFNSLDGLLSVFTKTANAKELSEIITRYQQMIGAVDKLGNQQRKLTAYNNLGNCYLLLEDYYAAINFLKEAEAIGLAIGATEDLTRVYYNLSDAYRSILFYKQSDVYLSKFVELKDNLAKQEKEALNLTRKYELEKKDRELALIKLKEQETQSELQATADQRNLFIGLAILIAILGGSLVWVYIQRQKRTQENLKLSEEILQLSQEYDQKRYDDLLNMQERNISRAMMEGQENERERIAKELHDNINNLLTVVKIHFESLEEKIDDLEAKQVAHFQQASQTLELTTTELERIYRELNSGTLFRLGLAAALVELEGIFQPVTKMDIEIGSHGLHNRFKKQIELNLYRIGQELLGNALKHSKAKHFSLHFTYATDGLNIIAEDDGIGFDEEAVKAKGRNGLSNIRDRVKGLAGKMDIDSFLGKSTTIIIDIPQESLLKDE